MVYKFNLIRRCRLNLSLLVFFVGFFFVINIITSSLISHREKTFLQNLTKCTQEQADTQEFLDTHKLKKQLKNELYNRGFRCLILETEEKLAGDYKILMIAGFLSALNGLVVSMLLIIYFKLNTRKIKFRL